MYDKAIGVVEKQNITEMGRVVVVSEVGR